MAAPLTFHIRAALATRIFRTAFNAKAQKRGDTQWK